MSIRQGNSPRSRITQRIWPASRCGPQSHGRTGEEEANQAAAPAPQAAADGQQCDDGSSARYLLALRWSWLTGRCCSEIEIHTRLLTITPEQAASIELVSCRELPATSKMLLERAGSKSRRRDAGSNVPNVSTDVG